MGGKQTKQQIQESTVKIEHPRFQNAKVKQENGNLYMKTTMGVQQKDFNRWKLETGQVKQTPQYLLLAKNSQFATKGLCGSSGTLELSFQYFPYLLAEQIQNRKMRKSKFDQCELWFLLFSLSAAQTEMKLNFKSKVGDIRPQNIFINQDGLIKVSCLQSWPKQQSGFEKTFDHQQSLISPEQMNKLDLGGHDDKTNYQSQMFSIGMTILSTAMLTDFNSVYNIKKFKFRYQQMTEYLIEWRENTQYSEIFTAFISNLCSFEPEKRLNEKQLWNWISQYEEEIQSKEDFVIQQAPSKVQKQFQQIRAMAAMQKGQPNQDSQQRNGYGNMPQQFSQQMQFPNQQKSFVQPYVALPPQGQFGSINQQNPSNSVKVGQGLIPQSNIQVAQSKYTHMPTPQFNGVGNNSPQFSYQHGYQGYQPPILSHQQNEAFQVPSQAQSGNFIYTRRIIDPNSNNVVAEQQIQEHQYNRGLTSSGKREQ